MIFMTKKVMSELRGMSSDALELRLAELKAELAKERSLIASGTRPESPGKIRKLKKSVARLLTILNERKAKEVTK